MIDAFTESVDILPTVVDLCGGTPPPFCDGASLRPFLDTDLNGIDAPERWRDCVHTEYDFRMPTSSMVQDTFGLRHDQCAVAVIRDRVGKYVQFGGDLPPLFFDLSEDPDELVDLVSVPDRSGQVLDYAQRLLRLRIEHTDARLANHRATPFGARPGADPPRP